jgi:hypothetical protein
LGFLALAQDGRLMVVHVSEDVCSGNVLEEIWLTLDVRRRKFVPGTRLERAHGLVVDQAEGFKDFGRREAIARLCLELGILRRIDQAKKEFAEGLVAIGEFHEFAAGEPAAKPGENFGTDGIQFQVAEAVSE